MNTEHNNSVLKENEYGFVEDPRYKVCNREAMYGMVLGLINLLIWLIAGYGLGSGDPETYTYVMGFPLWFFISCIVNTFVAIAATIYIVKVKLVDMSLEPMTMEEAEAFERTKGVKA